MNSSDKFLLAYELQRETIRKNSQNKLNQESQQSRENYSKLFNKTGPAQVIVPNIPRNEHAKILGVKETPDSITQVLTGNIKLFSNARTPTPKEKYTMPAPDDNPYMKTSNKKVIQNGRLK